jgi:hypothetical protein
VVAELAEVLRPQAVEGGAVELRRPADEVVDLRLERLPLRVVPRVVGDVAVVDEHVLREPVLRLARQPAASLEQEDLLARGREVPGKRAAARTRPDDDHVIFGHFNPPLVARRFAWTIPKTSRRCIVRTG